MQDKINVAIIGANGAIGGAFLQAYAKREEIDTIFAFSRNPIQSTSAKIQYCPINLEDETSIKQAADFTLTTLHLDHIIVASGILHQDSFMPEKSLKEVNKHEFEILFAINTIGPALAMKHFLPRLAKDKPSIFATLSARVGSIGDNQLGGWYSYRASKAALNMVIKNAAIELARTHKEAAIIGLHPGTVDSALSKPFQNNVPEGKLFTPESSVSKLMQVIETITPNDSGKTFAWDGKQIEY